MSNVHLNGMPPPYSAPQGGQYPPPQQGYAHPQQPYHQPQPMQMPPMQMAPMQMQQQQQTTTVVVGTGNTNQPAFIVAHRERFADKICLNLVISFLFFPWICVWIVLCIVET